MRRSRIIDRHPLLTIVIIATLIATPGYFRLEGLVQDIVDARSDARVVACNAQNDQTLRINAILTSSAQPRDGQSRTSDEQAAVDRRLASYLIPLRDCSPAGVDAYYSKGKP